MDASPTKLSMLAPIFDNFQKQIFIIPFNSSTRDNLTTSADQGPCGR